MLPPNPAWQDLIDPQARSVFRRFFPNDARTLVAELLQNAQRAHARTVTFTFAETEVTYADDGHGLTNATHGLDALHTVLRIGGTDYQDPAVWDQDPMGMGLQAVLAHDQVQQVTIISGGMRLALDTQRFWNDPAYYTTWYERVEKDPRPGFTLMISCSAELAQQMRKVLMEPSARGENDLPDPPLGYEDRLSITCNGQPVQTAVPKRCLPDEALLETTYEGQRLVIGFRQNPMDSWSSWVNWYGQLIEDRFDYQGFAYYLDVRDGRPVHPMGPVRSRLIEDEARARLHQFVWDQIFAVLAEPPGAASSVKWLEAAEKHDKQRALQLPVCIVQQYPELSPDKNSANNFHDIDPYSWRAEKRVVRYDAAPLLVKNEVVIHLESGIITQVYGVQSFTPLTGPIWHLAWGDPRRVQQHVLHWQPGKQFWKYGAVRFFEPGEWALALEGEEPSTWHPVEHTVFAFSTPNELEVSVVDFIVGTRDVREFFRHWAIYGHAPSRDMEEFTSLYDQEEQYREGFEDAVREWLGNCVSFRFTYYDVHRQMASDARVTQVRFLFPSDEAKWPESIEVTNEAGETKILRLFDGRP